MIKKLKLPTLIQYDVFDIIKYSVTDFILYNCCTQCKVATGTESNSDP